jgi:hypothetical protein
MELLFGAVSECIILRIFQVIELCILEIKKKT